MSVRGIRGSRGRGRGTGRGRGRKPVLWEWESYTPGSDVYDQLWRIRREPAKVSPRLLNECPISDSRTTILDRRQTEGDIQRNFYVVQIQALNTNYSATSGTTSESTTKTEHVDVSCILQYVSPQQLEDFENEQFRAEAEAEAEAMRQKIEELARLRSQKKTRGASKGRGSRTLNGSGLNVWVPRKRGSKGCGRWINRSTWTERASAMAGAQLNEHDPGEIASDFDTTESPNHDNHVPYAVAETDSESQESDGSQDQANPNLMRSAFVANSALSVSPVQSHQRFTGLAAMRTGSEELSDSENSDNNLLLIDVHAQAVSINPDQRSSDHGKDYVSKTLDEEFDQVGRYHSKRRKIGSAAQK